MDMGDRYPSAEITGIDLSPTQTDWTPPNVTWEVDDMEEPWTFRQPFDFIHGKWLAGSIHNWPRLMQQCYHNTKPSGWVEFKDWDYTPRLANGTVEVRDNYVNKWHKTMMTGCEEKTGASASPGPLLKNLLINAGFEDVKEVVCGVVATRQEAEEHRSILRVISRGWIGRNYFANIDDVSRVGYVGSEGLECAFQSGDEEGTLLSRIVSPNQSRGLFTVS